MKKWLDHDAEISPTQEYLVQRWRDGKLSETTDRLAEEVPIALVYNGVSHAVMLASPQDLEDFGLGFSLTEGILTNQSELYDIDVREQENGIELHLEIASEQFIKLKNHRRSMAGRTGCGLCGAESLMQVFHLPEAGTQLTQPADIKMSSIFKAHHNIQTLQTLQKVTGATHACAWSDETGHIHYVREDVGRHNALDKLMGALVKQRVQGGFILTTSRASYEMVQKVAMMGFSLLAAISAPTGLAVRIADEYNITLLGFVREQQFVAYSHANRLIQ
jgi:FdhD protein